MKKTASVWSFLFVVGILSTSVLVAQHDHGTSGHPGQDPFPRAAPSVPVSPLAFEKIRDEYYRIQDALARDTTAGVDKAAKNIAKVASKAQQASLAKNPDFEAISRAANALQGTRLEQAREQFFELSKPIIAELQRNASIKKPAFAYDCSMAKKSWVQAKKDIRNPYYGKSMLKCGEPL